jgi:hypothetical protein
MTYLDTYRPKGFLIEQVEGFSQIDREDAAGRSFLQKFIDMTVEKGFSVRALEMRASVWSECERRRRAILHELVSNNLE